MRSGAGRATVVMFVAGAVFLNAHEATGYNGYTREYNGDPDNRVDIVIMGDGYRGSELGQFQADADLVRTWLFLQEPLSLYRSYFNVHYVEVISAESGIDHPDQDIFRETALDTGYYDRCITSFADDGEPNQIGSQYHVWDAAADAPAPYDTIIVVANDSESGGCGFGGMSIAYVARNADIGEVAAHEFGHSFGHLADEYVVSNETFPYPEPNIANVTTKTVRSEIKWNAWIDASMPVPTPGSPSGVGLFEGARYYAFGIYRPTYDSLMRSLYQPWQAVNSEQLIKRIYDVVNPIESTEFPPPNCGSLFPVGCDFTLIGGEAGVDSVELSVNLCQPSTNSVETVWLVDGEEMDSGPTFTVSVDGAFAEGYYTVQAVTTDETPLVRNRPTGRELSAVTEPWHFFLSRSSQSPAMQPMLRILAPDVAGPWGIPTPDGEVDLANDIQGVIQHYSPDGDEDSYDPRFDLDANGVIDLSNDILTVIFAYDTACWPNAQVPDLCAGQELAVPEGRLLQFYLKGTPTPGWPLVYSVPWLPEGATFTTCPNQMTTCRLFQWVPSAAQLGSHELRFRADDGTRSEEIVLPVYVFHPWLPGASGAAPLSLSQVSALLEDSPALAKELPAFEPIEAQTVAVSGKLSLTVAASTPYPPLHLRAGWVQPDGSEVPLDGSSEALGATFTDNGAAEQDGCATGTVAWTPKPEHVGLHTMRITATDVLGLSRAVTVPITVLPPLTITNLTDSPDPFGPLPTDLLPDATTIQASLNRSASWTLVIKHPTDPAITRTFTGSSASISQAWQGQYLKQGVWTPVPRGVTYTYTLSAKDAYGSSAKASGTVTVK